MMKINHNKYVPYYISLSNSKGHNFFKLWIASYLVFDPESAFPPGKDAGFTKYILIIMSLLWFLLLYGTQSGIINDHANFHFSTSSVIDGVKHEVLSHTHQ